MSDKMRNVDFLITTLDRYYLLEQLLNSIFKYYPNAKVTVADQSRDIKSSFYNQWSDKDLRVFPLPYDCGLSFARNILVENTDRDYKLLLEDDFKFTEQTDIKKLKKLMDVADIAGGSVYKAKNYQRLPFECYLKKYGKELWQVSDGEKWKKYKGVNYKKTGCVMNFAMFRKNVFYDVKWDNRLKLREHQHFFYRARRKKIVYTDDVRILDNKKGAGHPNYRKMKGRDEFWKIAMEDLGINKVRYINGQVVEWKDDKIWRYKEII